MDNHFAREYHMAGSGGIIYAIGTEGTALIKIGSTTESLAKRRSSLQTGHPLPLRVLGFVAVAQEVRGVEKAVHRLLAPSRRRGEWFAFEFDATTFAAMVERAVDEIARAVEATALKEQRAHEALCSSNMMIRLGARVRASRKTLGWRQGVLAEKAGINPGNLSEIEHGRKPSARIDTLAALAEALQVSTDYLLGFTDDAHPVWARQEML